MQHNTTSGLFRKVGRLYGSCLRQTTNSSTIFLLLQQLGGYLPIGALGPSTVAPLLSKINEYGSTPLVDIYYDLSYGRKPKILLIVGGPTTSSPILEVNKKYIKFWHGFDVIETFLYTLGHYSLGRPPSTHLSSKIRNSETFARFAGEFSSK